MDRKVPLSDATISKNVSQQLAGRGLRSPCRIQVQTRNGEVTLSGTVQFVHQRDAAVQAIRTVEGVTRIVEKLKVTRAAKHQYAQTAKEPLKEAPVEELQAASEETTAESKPEPSAEAPPAGSETTDADFGLHEAPRANSRAPGNEISGTLHTRKGDSYTFECANPQEAERLRAVLVRYADWLKKNSWVGESKANGGMHRVTFHAKSVIDFLRQEGF